MTYMIYMRKRIKKLDITEQQVTTWTDPNREAQITFAQRTSALFITSSSYPNIPFSPADTAGETSLSIALN